MVDPGQFSFFLIGEAVVDFISNEDVKSLEDACSFNKFAGGQVSNIAMNLAKLGCKAELAACLGIDSLGRFLNIQLEEAGVNIKNLQFTDLHPTSLVAVSRTTKTPDFRIYRGADQALILTDDLSAAVDRSDAFHTSAFALSRDPCRSTILTLLRNFKKSNKLISLDTNYHPEIWPDRDDFLPFLKDLLAEVTVIKPSIEDSWRIFGPGYTPDQYLNMFLDLGPEIVVLTMGEEGCILGNSRGEYHHLIPSKIDAVDVTGAGDAFWSGMLIGLSMDLEPLKAAQLGQSITEQKISVVGPVAKFKTLDYYLEVTKIKP
jgi:sugar/nucleoside kinase (ribokinase family)